MHRQVTFAKKQQRKRMFINYFFHISKCMCQFGHILLSFQACCASIVAILSEAFLLRGVIAKRLSVRDRFSGLQDSKLI